MNKRQVIDYYRKNNLAKRMVENTENREIGGTFSSGGYTSRPKILEYEKDLLQMVKQGVVAFHGSVERWKNPMELDTSLSKEAMDRLRSGWDLIIDIDSNTSLGLDAAKAAAKRTITVLEKNGVESYGLKFSGRRGFHISIPWPAFPKQVGFKETRKQFPRIPQAVAGYIRNEIKEGLLDELIEMKGSHQGLIKEMKKDGEELFSFEFVDVEKNWGSRHLFRLPYSLHEKSWLVSLPLARDELEGFEKSDARPEKVEIDNRFFKKAEANEASGLVERALNWYSQQNKRRKRPTNKKKKKDLKPEEPVDEEKFPPCIKTILKGVEDGRKRSVFILINFLRNMNWDWDRIEEKLEEWNQNNRKKLSKNYIDTQLKWFQRQNKEMLPPSCDNEMYYRSFGVCHPDKVCKQGGDEIVIKNPVVYPFRKKGD
ncbi:MAG: hypothetical protein ACLFS3_00505 [Candidatus Aenigmatarchaeota archaeon]